MDQKICVITGTTDGVGLETARTLGRDGWALALVARNAQKGERIAAELRAECQNEQISFMQADLSLQRDVRRVASELAEAYPRIDVLINNAGAIFWKRKQTDEGLEATFALNHLNYFLLTNLLLDQLKAAPSARIVNVASRAHVGASVDFDDLGGKAVYKRRTGGWIAYQRSKLQNIMFTNALTRRLEGSTVTANALHPGFVKTRFGKDNGGAFAVILNIGMRISAISVEKGAETQTYLARSPEVEGVSGKYFSQCREVNSTKQSMDEAAQERLWSVSEEMTRGSE
jgi:NAD(P)-dependent dehydrogenase (short-subunit alcohol dehydrogenase family)